MWHAGSTERRDGHRDYAERRRDEGSRSKRPRDSYHRSRSPERRSRSHRSRSPERRSRRSRSRSRSRSPRKKKHRKEHKHKKQKQKHKKHKRHRREHERGRSGSPASPARGSSNRPDGVHRSGVKTTESPHAAASQITAPLSYGQKQAAAAAAQREREREQKARANLTNTTRAPSAAPDSARHRSGQPAAQPLGMKPRSVNRRPAKALGAAAPHSARDQRRAQTRETPPSSSPRQLCCAPGDNGAAARPKANGGKVVKVRENDRPDAAPVQAALDAAPSVVTCCECEDQPADVHCVECGEDFCRPCWGGQHRRGKRSLHTIEPILGEELARAEQPEEPSSQPAVNGAASAHKGEEAASGDAAAADSEAEASLVIGPALPPGGMAALYSNDSEKRLKTNRLKVRYIPLRLDAEERSLLALLQGALHVSEYTDKVDVFSQYEKVRIMLSQMWNFLHTQSGLQICASFKAGQRLMRAKSPRDNYDWFARAFEVGRRYKIMNPQKMRTDYGKMMYLLMDTKRSDVREQLRCNLVLDIKTVGKLLKDRHGEALLASEDFDEATQDLSDTSRDRAEMVDLQKKKREAMARIIEKYSTDALTADDIARVLESVSDANNFLASNMKPVVRILELLRENFNARGSIGDGKHSLEIGRGGNARMGGQGHTWFGKRFSVSSMAGSRSGGAKLSHSHAQQFAFTTQTFMLWREICRSMYQLWLFADHDMLHNAYRLSNTGQGLQRVQQCPRVAEQMHRFVNHVQQRSGSSWVGLTVVHLGDRDVPNALTFIDKYTQVPRILAPIISCVQRLPELDRATNTASYLRALGGAHLNKMTILADFFKHGFDGSGDDGGSCIDGRLTSAWNCARRNGLVVYLPTPSF